MTSCEIDECGGEIYRRTWCGKHYAKWYKYGDPLAGRTNALSPEESFALRTRWVGDCLIWTGSITTAGYGNIWVGGGKVVYVHRYAWERVNGPIHKGLVIDHKCHNRACCNDTHLRAVTSKQNNENHKGLRRTNTSGYRGVYRNSRTGNYYVQVRHDGVNYSGGTFASIDDANIAAIALRNRLFTINDKDRP